MKCAVWPSTGMQQIPRNTTELHLVRPLSLKKLKQIAKKRKIQTVYCGPSTEKRLRPKTRQWLTDQKIALVIQRTPGRPLAVSLSKMLSVAEMCRDHRSFREIQKTTGIAKSTAHYWVSQAKRHKIRFAGKTIFLQ